MINKIICFYKIIVDKMETEAITLKNKNSTYYIEVGDNDYVDLQDRENSVDIDVDGTKFKGWLNYLNSSGEMLSNTTVSGYKLGKSGAWIK